MFNLSVSIYHDDNEDQFEIEPERMSQGALEDSIIRVMNEHPDATEFVFVVRRLS